MTNHDLVAHAQALLDENSYLTLATADPEGRPWTSPVYFAVAERWEFYWVSAADSVRLAGHPPGHNRSAGTRSAAEGANAGGLGECPGLA
jgi:hypothetical protein